MVSAEIENNSDNSVIANNSIYRNNVGNIDWDGGLTIIANSDYITIRNNQIYSNQKFYNMLLENATYCTVVNNLIYGFSMARAVISAISG